MPYSRDLPGNKTERRCGCSMNDAQRLASKENFALFQLKGRTVDSFREYLPQHLLDAIEKAQQAAITHIKETQRLRKENKK